MATEMNPVNWFEIPANDLNRAKGFYEYVLGVQLAVKEVGPLQMAWFPMIRNGPGATGSLVKADGYKPSTAGTLVYFSVHDIEATLTKVKDKAGRVLTPKTSIGQYGFIAHFRDCEGNRVGLHSMA